MQPARDDSASNTLSDLLPVLERIYGQPTLLATAYEIVNEGRRYLGCDRLSLFSVRQQRARLLAISGVDKITHAAQQVRQLDALVQAVVLTGREFLYRAAEVNPREHAPQLESLLQRYLDSTTCTCLIIQPLKDPRSVSPESSNASSMAAACCGALVVENTAHASELSFERLTALISHVARAVALSAELEATPLLSLGRSWQRLAQQRGRHLSKATIIGAALALILIASLLIPSELTIPARGRYYPSEVQHIYAPLGGEITAMKDARENVKIGDSLAVIRSREWELKKEELLTGRGVTLEKLRGVESARLNARRNIGSEPGNTAVDLSATERELRELLASQDQQLALVQKTLDSLSIASPLEGTIISWNPLEYWVNRPVQQGQKLMSIAASSGPGWLHLRVSDVDVRHVSSRRAQTDQPLTVTFSLASQPGTRFQAMLVEVGTITETMPGDGPSVRLKALVEPTVSLSERHGATVVARIHCGRRSLAYVWTRRLWDYMLLNWWPW